jgi:HK97 family phage major capsid protein
VLGEIGKVHDTGKANHGEIVALKEKADKLEAEVQKSHGDLELVKAQAAAEMAVLKATLQGSYGKSGAEDFQQDLDKFLRGAFMAQKHNKRSSEVFSNGANVGEQVEKTAHQFTTTDATFAGNLLPTILMPGIREVMDVYGNLYPRLTRFTLPAGQSARVNSEGVRPVAAFRATQSTDMTEEPTGATYLTDTLVTQLVYVYQRMSNELMANPNVNFGSISAMAAIKAIVRLVEGYVLNLASDAPSKGVIGLTAGGGSGQTFSQTTISTFSFAGLVAFLKECVADNTYAIDPGNKIFLHPRDVLTLATQAVGTGELTGMLVWGDPRKGIPTTLLGYEVIVHPGCYNGTNNYILLGDPAAIYLAETGQFGVDFSDQVGFKAFETAMRVYSHMDWSIMQPNEWHKAILTA